MARVMIVDDQADLAKVLKISLEDDGHSVTVACDGAEALRMLGLEPEQAGVELPDLILLDVMMPHCDGYSINAQLFKNERTKNLPVIIMTGNHEMRDLFEYATKGRVFLPKPFKYKEMRAHIQRLLGLRS